MSEWQPISNAPKNGTDILIRDVDYVTQAFWDVINPQTGRGRWKPVWLDVHGCGCCGGDDPEPTHWMPLPDPPKEGE